MKMDKEKLPVYEPKKKVGLIVVITGDGKGKTPSALGMALRAVGYQMKVCIIHFIKGDMYAGEMDGIQRLSPEVEVHLTGKGFCGIMGDTRAFEEHRASAQDAIRLAKEKMLSDAFDILILDEVNNTLKLGLIDLPQLINIIDSKPPLMHLILTGRDAHPEVIQRAHTATEMQEIKHAFRQGIEPQKGIDY